MVSRIWRCVLALVLAVSASAFAQETRGTIVGRVLDEQGGAMPGVSVTITNVATNVSTTLTTNMLNRQQFANPQLNPTSTDFGRVTANANTEPRFLILMSKVTF